MKLVDILARGLKVFPESYRYILFDGANGCYADLGPTTKPLTIDCSECTDELEFPVYKDQWQAAVDALKDIDRDRDADLKALVDAIMSRMPSTPINIAFESARFALGQRDEMIKAIRTPEQIAAADKSRAINEMIDGLEPFATMSPLAVCEWLYDAGYRKFEIVDN